MQVIYVWKDDGVKEVKCVDYLQKNREKEQSYLKAKEILEKAESELNSLLGS